MLIPSSSPLCPPTLSNVGNMTSKREENKGEERGRECTGICACVYTVCALKKLFLLILIFAKYISFFLVGRGEDSRHKEDQNQFLKQCLPPKTCSLQLGGNKERFLRIVFLLCFCVKQSQDENIHTTAEWVRGIHSPSFMALAHH